MLEAMAIPVLLKAVEFLFGEGSKILEERRVRRMAQNQESVKETESASPSHESIIPPDAIRSQEIALKQPITESAWLSSEANIKHLVALLAIHTKNYHLAREQYAMFGSAYVPPIIVHNLTEAEDQIKATTKELQGALSQVFGKNVAAIEVEQA